VTPTYVACPATDAIVGSIRDALIAAGADDVRVDIALAPAWTTDWITDEGRRKLAEYGIAPPPGVAAAGVARVDVAGIGRSRPGRAEVACPRCGSRRTRVLSAFGSTACKALLRCDDCLEPFDWFKPH
jgi:ring-1,2-phenylacetyl-CoA epoxidase subunit PaaD